MGLKADVLFMLGKIKHMEIKRTVTLVGGASATLAERSLSLCRLEKVVTVVFSRRM